ncbi:hypothetical protein [Bradyrhizobium sp. STM 3566]|uniref:hypothetical protein n=1 Tax=Bradyrhizobium sp. STM 3566 TaxID=578928 RepID=UPI00388DBA52
MAVFYGLFYVVIEGYRPLELKEEAIDALLGANDYESRLRRFRNAVFHYQADPFDKRTKKSLVDGLSQSLDESTPHGP